MLIIQRFINGVLSLTLLFSGLLLCAAKSPQPVVSAQSAVLLHNGTILFEKSAHVRLPMASTTKLMTAIIALERLDLKEYIPIREEYCCVEGSSMYLRPETSRCAEDLIKGLLLVSGNDAAIALAVHIAGSIEAFTREMNRKASQLGMKNTHFSNPHGLSEPQHYSTAYDLGKLMEYCIKNGVFSRITAMKSFESDGTMLYNHNRLLSECRGCTGGKTGYTMAAGRCLVSACRREGAQTVCVTLNAPDDWNDHKKLYDWCYENYEMRSLTEGQHFFVPILSRSGEKIKVIPEKEYALFVPVHTQLFLKIELPWFVFTPVEKGERAGRAAIYIDERFVGEYYFIYSETKSLVSGEQK